MVRDDWAQHGTAMAPQSAVIRTWLGSGPYAFAVTDSKRFDGDHDADAAVVRYIDPQTRAPAVFAISELATLTRENTILENALVLLHPSGHRLCDTVRCAVEAGSVRKLFILVWSRTHMVRTWLEGVGALNLHTKAPTPATDPLLLAAAEMIKNEDYNGLAGGNGKATIVQLARAFHAEGYPLEPDPWLRAYFAAGGSFRHAEALEKLVQEMQSGTRHRVPERYRPNIVEILRDQIARRTD